MMNVHPGSLLAAATTAYSATYNNYNHRPASAVRAAASAAIEHEAPAVNGNHVAAIVSISAQALAALAGQSDTVANRYTACFPTRDGASAAALANAVTHPGATSSSTGLSFSAVAADARARMDAEYAAMKDGGQPFDMNSYEGKDWYSLMGDLDRRSLYAVSSNTGGQFTQQEQDMASSIMSQQQGLAMGLYSGPTRQASQFNDPFAGNDTGRFAAASTFLQGVSAEEKQSGAWLQQSTLVARLAAQDDDENAAKPMTFLDILIAADKKRDALEKLYANSDDSDALPFSDSSGALAAPVPAG